MFKVVVDFFPKKSQRKRKKLPRKKKGLFNKDAMAKIHRNFKEKFNKKNATTALKRLVAVAKEAKEEGTGKTIDKLTENVTKHALKAVDVVKDHAKKAATNLAEASKEYEGAFELATDLVDSAVSKTEDQKDSNELEDKEESVEESTYKRKI